MQHLEKELRERVRESLDYLFDEFGAKFVPNDEQPEPRTRGVVLATLEVNHLRLKAVSFRDGFYMEVATASVPKQWEEIGTVLGAIDARKPVTSLEDVPAISTHLPLTEIGALLKRHFEDLQVGLSEINYATTMEAVRKIKELRRDEDDEERRRTSKFYRDHPEKNPWNKKGEIQTLGIED